MPKKPKALTQLRFPGQTVEVGLSAEANNSSTSTTGVTQESLAASIANSNNCRLSVIHEFKEKVLSSQNNNIWAPPRRIGTEQLAIGDPFYKLRMQPGAEITTEQGHQAVVFRFPLGQVRMPIKGKDQNITYLVDLHIANYEGSVGQIVVVLSTSFPCAQNPLLDEAITSAKADLGDAVFQKIYPHREAWQLSDVTVSVFERNGERRILSWNDTSLFPPRSCSIITTTEQSG